ncbi:DUF2811 domain-containing protein [Aphanizomenon flos-aquae NRERC-008]|jgi:hypothetical protein|uniref:DUF2811 domain-containing protein n=3 Tax=Aphanizomenon flos-aquae TaxID=1176 RepID=A0A1B7X7K6_APHFL|nr:MULTISPECIES: DUF2811 domain-containing protein [Aphanizomenon]MBD1216908.1 DUF2811 domain-containing protein [Aphanizomenon flos-aquae Clear-A1]MBO1044631.1 DUF2811 domain-containing protein [Aphanizomenon flos-aquae UKL13-PB]MBO1058910.1 DUF2811 domain-containing protein [Dolichospermum sp. JUN01]MBO1062463.1 DUF2811 domain-containing protein [Aphanizomenon flos-aquae CP01]MCE2906863.1 DUF2811 domain-containing protein [Anabaena sp. CoA2_C59]MDJ0506515.1 DUF2811 domain-containing protein
MNTTVPILTEIPTILQESMNNYLESHPDWDQNRVLTAALSLFLLQNGESDRRAARVYLETLFHQ